MTQSGTMVDQYSLLPRLLIAVVLTGMIGFEREIRQKNAGLRTHALVGLGAAVIMVVSQYGFFDVLQTGRIVLDPSRIAAQVVSGIGFIGGGLIFVRQDTVRGLTTAASVWLAAGIGLTAGAGLFVVAIGCTILGVAVVDGLDRLERVLPQSTLTLSRLRLIYRDEHGTLQKITQVCADHDIAISDMSFRRNNQVPATVTSIMRLRKARKLADVVAHLGEIEGVLEVAPMDMEFGNID